LNSVPKLAVAIPSFNRAALLDEILWIIGPQVDRHAGQCVCYVIDNCSTDNTPEVVEQHRQRWKGVFYHRNEANVGLVRNIARGIAVPNAEWVWLLGDDDVPMPYAVKSILDDLDRLGSRDLGFVLLKGAKVDEERRFCPGSWYAPTAKGDPVQVFEPGSEIISVEGIHCIAWLSLLVVRRSCWDQALFDRLYRETDLYTFVNVLLQISANRSSAFSKRLTVLATDRGSRAYYFAKTAIARLSEFPEIETFIVQRHGMRRAKELLRHDRRGWFRQRLAFALKMAVFRDEYALQQHLLEKPISPFLLERWSIRAVTALARIGIVQRALKAIYRSRRADREFSQESINRSA
jgi:glycosyltransferase involved in cell wall biosynthesis